MKPKFKILLFVSILIFGLNACKDEENNFGATTYRGKVYERGSTIGIANCPILIHGYEVVNPWGSADMPVIVETNADSNGNYSITWEAEKGKRYFIYPESPNHYGNSKGQPIWELKQFGKTVTKDLEQWPLAYVKMKLFNRQKYKNYTDISFGSNLSGINLFPQSKDTNYVAVVWGNMQDSVGYGIYNGKNLIKREKFAFNINAWQMDSITIEY